jgi:hypothetical protein
MKVVGHDYELVQRELSFLAVMKDCVHEESRHAVGLKE